MIELREFDIKRFVKNTVSVIVGAKQSGKTTLITDLLRKLNIPDGLVVGNDAYNLNKIPNFETLFSQAGESVVIIDEGEIKSNEIMRKLFYQGRHPKITTLLATEKVELPIDLRANTHYVFCLQCSQADKEHLHRKFFARYSFESFSEVFDRATQDHGCLVLYRTIKSDNIEDNAFYWKAQFIQGESPSST